MQSFDHHKNFGYSTVATAPSPAGSGTSLVVADSSGFDDPASAGAYNATVWPAGAQPTAANAEVVRVTAKSGSTLTITRTQETSSARSIIVGDQIAVTITAKTITDLENVNLFQNEFVSTEDELIRANSQVILADEYEVGSGFVTELASTALLAVGTESDQTVGFTSGADQYGGYLELLTTP